MKRKQRAVRRAQEKPAPARKHRADPARWRQRLKAFGSGVADFIAELLEVLAP